MLAFLQGRASDRKARLFACAYSRSLWDADQFGGPLQRALEVAEAFADGLAGEQELAEALAAASWDTSYVDPYPAGGMEESGAAHAAVVAVSPRLDLGFFAISRVYTWTPTPRPLLLDIFGNPSRPVHADPAWLAWHGGAAVKLAAAVYEERELPSGHLDAARLAVLADMLEEAGCSDADLLGHLRSPGPHVRGCWPLDALLGRS
jgi:hypothetical protein